MRFGRATHRLGTLATLMWSFTFSTAVAAPEGDPATICHNAAAEYCFNTRGYTSAECEADYVSYCMSTFDRPTGPTDWGPEGRDCTGGIAFDGDPCTRVG
jgi:hypothetical protein